jgi:hypothetical protein
MAQGTPHREDGFRLALGAAQRDPAAVAYRTLHVQHGRQRYAWRHGNRQSARELHARTGAELRDLVPGVGDSGTRAHSGVLRAGRLEGIRSPDHQRRAALHPQLPVDRDQRSDCRVQPGDPAARLPGRRTRPAAREEQLRAPVRRGLSRHRQDDRQLRIWARLDRNGRHHHAVHDADVSVPPGGDATDARQHRARVRPVERTDSHANRAHGDGGSRAGRVHGGRYAWLRVRPAMERVDSVRSPPTRSSSSRTSVRRSRRWASRTATSIS